MIQNGASRAHVAVHYAIKKGKLAPITTHTKCVDCGHPAKHYDHRDYGQPLIVEPVCQKCNVKRGPAKPFLYVKKNVIRRNISLTDQQSVAIRYLSKNTGLPVVDHIRRAVDDYLRRFK